jgi:hypothetical protein
MKFDLFKPLLGLFALITVCVLLTGACSSNSQSDMHKKRNVSDCVSAGNAPSTCRGWIGN